MTSRTSAAYQRVERLIAADRCVLLDGGVATELERVELPGFRISDAAFWGSGALFQAPYAVLEVHRRYVQAGCDVLSTNTWALIAGPELDARAAAAPGGPTHWMDAARQGVRLARQAVQEAGRTDQCAVAFS